MRWSLLPSHAGPAHNTYKLHVVLRMYVRMYVLPTLCSSLVVIFTGRFGGAKPGWWPLWAPVPGATGHHDAAPSSASQPHSVVILAKPCPPSSPGPIAARVLQPPASSLQPLLLRKPLGIASDIFPAPAPVSPTRPLTRMCPRRIGCNGSLHPPAAEFPTVPSRELSPNLPNCHAAAHSG